MQLGTETFEQFWQTLDLTTVELSPEDSFQTSRVFSEEGTELEVLPRLMGIDGREQVVLGELIGVGGMGEVRAATQAGFRRQVAVKTLKPSRDGELQRRELVREAVVHASLEHPNIVPVHVVGLGPDGRPLLVMKKVEGTAWSSVLRTSTHPLRAAMAGDPLGWHIDILRQVCRAVEFAHSRGIVHRDLKPANVMIGAFGDVYVLDWGIAISVRAGGGSHLPRQDDWEGAVGTPGFIAPEMLSTSGRVDHRADIYLLGSILHQIVTGKLRHGGDSLQEVLLSSWESQPYSYPRSVDSELAAICNRATARDPDERFATVRGFREALEAFLAHRSSSALAAAASERLDELEALGREAEHDPRFDVLLGECRFGFRAALDAWPGNERAQQGFKRALSTAISRELSQGRARPARLLFSELAEPDPKLEALIIAVEEQERERAAELQELRQERAEWNLEQGARARFVFAVSMLVLWMGVPIATWLAVTLQQRPLREVELLVPQGLTWLVSFGVVYYLRGPLQRNEVSKRVLWSFLAIPALLVVTAGAWGLSGQSPEMLVATIMLVTGGMVGVLALTQEFRLLWAAGGFGLGALVGSAVPGLALLALGLSNGFAFLSAAWIWRGGDRRRS